MLMQYAAWFYYQVFLVQLLVTGAFTMVMWLVMSGVRWFFTRAHWSTRYIVYGCIAVTVLYFLGLV